MLSHRIRFGALGVSLVLATAASAWPAPVAAQAAPGATSEVTAEGLLLQLQLCRSLKNRAFRLNCFDSLARDLPREAGVGPGAIAEAAPEGAGGVAATIPLPRPRPARAFELAEAQVPEMEEVGRKTAVAVAGPGGTDWQIAPSPRVEVARGPEPRSYQVVESREIGGGGLPPASIFAQNESSQPKPEPGQEPVDVPKPPSQEPSTELAALEESPDAPGTPAALKITPLPEPGSSTASEIAALFDFTSRAEAAPAPATGDVPLPPDPPERLDFAGLLDGEISTEPQPGAGEETSVDGAAIADIAPDGAIATASLGDAPISPTIKRNWSVSGWTSPLSGVRDMTITRASDRVDDGPVTLLSFSCSNESGIVQVVWPQGMSAKETKAALVLDGEASEPAVWRLSADGRTMSREGRDEALATARKIAAADTIAVRILDDPAHEWDATFGTDGLESHLKEFGAACTG